MSFRQAFCKELLPRLSHPSRYLGTELNSVHKNAADVAVRVALVFPDLYDLGLGNLGVHILYALLNDLDWCWAERAYAPPPDLEEALREHGWPLFALESKDPLTDFDLVGFSLQSELTYANVLNILELAGIPLRTRDRDEAHPLILAGGPAAINPEPMAPFMDLFVIGDGEDAMARIAEVARDMRGQNRAARLEAMAKVPGVYVPELHRVGERIPRQMAAPLDAAPYPTRYIVPFAQLVHDRIGLEIMRGCTHGCRFCQAGMVGRPIRARSVDVLDSLMDKLVADTGYEEVSLVSLSTCDHPQIATLLANAAQRAGRDDFAVSVPSLRLDTFSVGLADAITGLRRSGLTFAPEAATPRLRRVINKVYEDEELIEVTTEAFQRGWEHVKLYFMIGLPTETDEDVEAIADLCLRVLDAGRAVNKRAKVFTGISSFVPKPFTPFQWAAQIPIDEIQRRHGILEQRFKRCSGIRFGRHEPESTFVEGLIARGGRGTADLIEAAFRNGARMESSSEHLNLGAWQEAIEQTGFDAEKAFAARELDKPLPWDHIDVLIPKQWLRREWERAMNGEETPDCREAGCRLCGVRDHAPALCATMLEDSRQSWGGLSDRPNGMAERVEPLPQQRVRFRIGRVGEVRFLSHLETMTAWVRTLRRARAPLAYSQGFHAHPKITFAAAPPVGEESEGDYMDIVLRERVSPEELLARVQATLPEGFRAFDVAEVPLNTASLMSAVAGIEYEIHAPGNALEVQNQIDAIMEGDAIAIARKGRPTGRRKSRETREIDIRPMITRLAVREDSDDAAVIEFSTVAVDGKMAKPKEVIELLGLDPLTTRVVKKMTHL